jgi:trehalose 6-phosphate synthase/phosphatase
MHARAIPQVVEVYNEGDLIWIHGFHLLVLPSFITKSLPTAKTVRGAR